MSSFRPIVASPVGSFRLLHTTTANAEGRLGAVPNLPIAHGQENIVEAWLTAPTGRYHHFVLGAIRGWQPHGHVERWMQLTLRLPETSVFEDAL